MSSLISEATILVRRDSASNWTTSDTVLGQGEWGYETDTGKIKIGDGSTAWTSLEYAAETGIVERVETIEANLSTYSTGWVANSDWTNALFTVTHNLATNLSDLIVKVFVSTDGTSPTTLEANSFEVNGMTSVAGGANAIVFIQQVDSNSLSIQTGADGILASNTSGVPYTISSQSWYYKVKVYKFS